MSNLPLFFAFSAGLLASVNPCGFAMLPGFVAYYLGSKESEESPTAMRLRAAILLGLAVTAGFMTLFVSAGVVLSVSGQYLSRTLPWLGVIIGLALVVLGIWTLLGHVLPVTLPTLTVKRYGRSPQAMFLYGIAYGLVSLGCALPVFLSVVAGALTTGGLVPSVSMFVSYSLGMGTVLVAMALGSVLLKGTIAHWLRGLLPHVKTFSSIILVVAGLYLIYQAATNPLGGF